MSDLAPNPRLSPRVLVVEDEPHICALLTDALEAEGYGVHCAQSDEAAYEALRKNRAFACMVVDVNLGVGTTGYDVARFARTIDPAVPVIFVSGQTSDASFLLNGVTGSLFIPKPFTLDELMDHVHRLVGDNDD